MKTYPKTLDALTEPWLIVPAKLAEIIEVYDHHLRREIIKYEDFWAIKNEISGPDENQEPYVIENGVALMPLEGIIAKRMNLFTKFSGGTSIQLFERDFKKALADPAVQSIFLLVDSPGGSVDGVQELANLIFESRGKKPIIAHTDGMMASAAYWIGSGAEQIFISGDTTQVGSIGVVAAHVDISKAEEKMGVKTTEIVAGKYKRIASRYEPLTEEGKTTIQEAVDHIYSIFVSDIARNRKVSEEKALSMADGKVFMGRQAINAGLVDGVFTLSGLIDLFGTTTSLRTIRAIWGENWSMKLQNFNKKEVST